MADQKAGKVKWVRTKSTYGFIVPDDGSPDVLLPVSVLKKAGVESVPAGQPVRYTALPNLKHPAVSRAISVTVG
jgi:cold shock protein